MKVEKTWKDPITDEKFSYGWGFDTDISREKLLLLTNNPYDKYKNEQIMKLYESKEKEIMEKISYVCGRCKENYPCNPRCVDCNKGSKFVERDQTCYAVMGRASGKSTIQAELYKLLMSRYSMFGIKDVKFNPPATIVFWADNTKTVVKAQDGDVFDPEKGLAMAIIKKLCGNKGSYNNIFHKWTAIYKAPEVVEENKTEVKEEPTWKIWFVVFDPDDGKQLGAGLLPYEYKRKGDATRRAKKHFEDRPNVEWVVSQYNPWEVQP